MKEALYSYDDSSITQRDFENTLVSLGITKGDILMVHSDTSTFGKLACFDKKKLLGSVIQVIQNVIGKEGTLLMPTFTYSFAKGEPFDIQKTKSTVGLLTEFFRTQEGVERTAHPTHSFAVWGKEKEKFMNTGSGTFDETSVFHAFHEAKGTFVALGVSLAGSCTYLHYIENRYKVPYRYKKKLRGTIINNGQSKETVIDFDNRFFPFISDFQPFDDLVTKKNLLKMQKLGANSISAIDANTLYDTGIKALDDDVYFFVKKDTPLSKFIIYFLYPFIKYSQFLPILVNELGSFIARKLRK